MSVVQITTETFSQRPENDFPQAGQEQSWIDIQLNVSSRGISRLYDEVDTTAVSQNQDGSFSVAAYLPESKWLISYLLSFGPEVKVLSPDYIRDMVCEQAQKIVCHYKE